MCEKEELKRLLLEMVDGILLNEEEDERKMQYESRQLLEEAQAAEGDKLGIRIDKSNCRRKPEQKERINR